MGLMGDAKINKGKGKGRGSVRNQDRLAGLKGDAHTGSADWGDADSKWVLETVKRITALGGACTFGLSRDGGAHMLALLLDGERSTLWFNGDADLDAELEKVCAYLETLE